MTSDGVIAPAIARATELVVRPFLAHPWLTFFLSGPFLLLSWYLWTYPITEFLLPYKNVPGPKAPSIILGHAKEIIYDEPNAVHTRWMEQYGPVVRYRSVFGQWRICLNDPTAIAYLTQHTYDFTKTPETTRGLHAILGQGVLTAEGARHRAQRRVMNAAFGPTAIKTMVDVFLDKAEELAAKLENIVEGISDEPASPTPAKSEDIVEGTKKVDVFKYLGQMTLDVIGLSGFEYNFDALADKENVLSTAMQRMLNSAQGVKGIMALAPFIPLLWLIPSKRKRIVQESRKACLDISTKLVEDKKRIIATELSGTGEKVHKGKDLLSLIVRANMDPALAEQRMSDQEVLDQICTFIVAGHETTSNALTFGLYRLALNQDVQTKLREEVKGVEERPSYDTLNSLPYLDRVVHEILRLEGPVPSGVRRATKHCVFPLSKPIVGRDGKLIEQLHVSPGTDIFIPIQNVNRSTEIWGPDAAEFNPDRYGYDGIPAKHVSGVYGNLLSFLGGARNCIGYRFAIGEMKAALFVLIRRLQFEPLPSSPTIKRRVAIVQRPHVAGEEKYGLQMPLLVRVVRDE